MSRSANMKNDIRIPCSLDLRPKSHVSFKLFQHRAPAFAKRRPGPHEPGHRNHDIHVAPINEPFRMMFIPYEGRAWSRLSLPVFRFQFVVTKSWRHQTAERPLYRRWSLCKRLLLLSQAGQKCMESNVLEQPLLFSSMRSFLLRGSAC